MLHAARTVALAALALVVAATGGAAAGFDTRRIVSIGGTATEILYALGVDDRIVAVDTTSIYPPEALSRHVSVGYMRQLSPEGILALQPSLVVLMKGSGPPPAIDVLKQAGVALVEISDQPTVEAAAERIRTIAAMVDRPELGAARAETLLSDVAAVTAALPADAARPGVLYLLSTAPDRLIAAGTATAAEALIGLAGGRNVAVDFTGYKQIAPEGIAALDPQAIVVMQRSEHAGTPAELVANPLIAATAAGKAGRILVMDGQLALGFGPRLPEAVRELARWLHPGVSFPAADAAPAAGQ